MAQEEISKIIQKQKEENIQEKRKRRIIDYFDNIRPFNDTDNIPDIPIIDEETYNNVIIPNLIRCGAIPKNKLVKGNTYIGTCRNATEAIWLGDKFEYIRYKFGYTYPEKINHFQDDDGCDVFVPLKEKK